LEQVVDDDWRIPDKLWARLEPLIPKYRSSKKGGRPRLDPRCVVDGIFYVLRTGMQWKAVPKGFGSGSSLHRYFQAWSKRGVFRKLWIVALEEYDELKGIQWEWQSLDGAMTKSPLGGEKNRPKSDRSGQAGHQTFVADRCRGRAAGRGGQRSQYARQTAA
jgi:transposase